MSRLLVDVGGPVVSTPQARQQRPGCCSSRYRTYRALPDMPASGPDSTHDPQELASTLKFAPRSCLHDMTSGICADAGCGLGSSLSCVPSPPQNPHKSGPRRGSPQNPHGRNGIPRHTAARMLK